MEDGEAPLSPSQFRDRMTEARRWLDDLHENDPTYDSKKLVAEGRLSNLEKAQKDPASWEITHREHEENLRSAQYMNEFLPLSEGHSSPSGHGDINPTILTPSDENLVNPFGELASDGVMSGLGQAPRPPSWNTISEQTTGSGTPETPNSSDRHSPVSVSSGDSTSIVPKKRRLESQRNSVDSSGPVTKAHCTAASPFSSEATTPESLEYLERPTSNAEHLNGGFGVDLHEASGRLNDSREEQLEHLRALEAKREQELADEAYARSLQESFNSLSPISVPRAGPSKLGSSQTYLGAGGRLHKPMKVPSASLPPDEEYDMYRPPHNGFKTDRGSVQPFKNEPGSIKSALANRTTFKKEPDLQEPHHIRSSSIGWESFISLSSDGEPEEEQNATSITNPSSDIVEIDPQTWAESYGQRVPNVIPPGNSLHNGFNDNVEPQHGWDAMRNTAQGYASGFSNAIGETMSTFGNYIGLGDTSFYGNAYSDSSMNAPIIDLEDLQQGTDLFYQRAMARAGFNPQNEELLNRYRERADYIAHDPTKTKQEMKELLENIRPDEDLPPENREGTPAAMTYPLMEHQKLGVAWMRRMEEGSNHGGILADDMGLGKTIQALALMVSQRSTDPSCKTTLIVAPVALLKQWESEIQKKLKPGSQHSLSTFIFHGAKARPSWEKLRTFDVVLTTFGVVATEMKRKVDEDKRTDPVSGPPRTKSVPSLIGDQCRWYRVIIDEAQCIKNRNTRAALGCCKLNAKFRFCMTGTPMMNNVGELYSLIRFLRIRPYCEREKFRHDIEAPLKSTSASARKRSMRQLQALLKSLLLRRTKKSKIDGKPILNLPLRTTTVQHSAFSDDEHAFYRALEMQTQLQFNKYLKAGTVTKNYSNILVLLLRLRQACCHPHLLNGDLAHIGSPSDLSAQDMVELAKELAPDVVNRIKEQAASNESSQLECPICMDMAANPTIFLPCGHNACSECFARITDPSQALQNGEAADGLRDAKCPNCRGKITPLKVIDLDAFKKVHIEEFRESDLIDEESGAEDDDSDDSDTDSSEDESDTDDEVDNKGNLKSFIIDDDEDDVKPKARHRKSNGKLKSKGKGKAKEKKAPKKTLAQLKKEAGIGSKARAKYLKKLAKDWQPSAKIDKTIEILRDIHVRVDKTTGQPEKTIIFSQFTSLLDLLEFPINREGWKYRRYDGSMTPNDRNEAVLDFTNKSINIMLVSLKAGNSGLNLTAASQVIIFDPFWNPYIEEQAIDRAHRIGQLRPVQVHRLLVEDTVEDRIVQLQEKKRELIESALDENASRSIGRLGVRELAYLFDVPT